MASTLLKLFLLSMCLNTFLYLGVNYAMFETVAPEHRPNLQDDLFSILLDDSDKARESVDAYVASLNSSTNATYLYSFEPSGNFSSVPDERTGDNLLKEAGGFAFLDVARMVIAFITTLWRIAFMPLYLFSYNLLPPLVAVIIGMPLFGLNVLAVISFLRGVSS